MDDMRAVCLYFCELEASGRSKYRGVLGSEEGIGQTYPAIQGCINAEKGRMPGNGLFPQVANALLGYRYIRTSMCNIRGRTTVP